MKTFVKNYIVVERESLLRDTSSKLEGMARQAGIVSEAVETRLYMYMYLHCTL